mmetsp:Transcript_24464/g.76834  ORF Transcript_24464/g.76834 Transcript_24464/m.76834 type:complete len:244 (-) Transcript_24464:453-1184(-)
MWVRTVWHSLNRARPASRRRLDSSMAAAPHRKRQLERSMERSLPRYQFCVIFSVDTTSASVLRCSCDRSSRRARSIEMTEAEQPMPPRLKDSTSDRMRKRLTSMAESDGVGQKSEQLTITMPMSSGAVPVDSSSCSTARHIIASASSRAPRIFRASRSASLPYWPHVGGKMAGGKMEASEMPDVFMIFSWNSIDCSLKHGWSSGLRASRDSSRKRSYTTGSPASADGSPPATSLWRYVLKSTR